MSVRREDVLHVARLAALAVEEADLERLVGQMSRIVDYVDQLNEVPAGEQAPPHVAGPERLALREDRVDSVPLSRPPAELAPEFMQGFFVVPKLGALGEE